MKSNKTKYTISCIFTISAVLFCAISHSCGLIETSGNKKLDGQWQLTAIDTLSTEGTTNMSEEKIYWLVENNLLELEDLTGRNQNILCRFEHTTSALRLYDPYFYDRDNGDSPIDDVQLLYPFGVEDLETIYTIEILKGSKMVLSTSTRRLHFRKI
ncbi:MAG: lipocalin-like domain-containing protein [Prevotella sp.]|nr:lipocalin-like domain-containing protein [Prevotella sp.]